MEISANDRETLERLESQLWRFESRNDRALMEQIFAADFFEVGRSGRLHTREASVRSGISPFHTQLPLPDFQARLLSPEVAQVTYTSVVTLDGELLRARRSSLWSREAGTWRLRFHQGTPLAGDTL